MVLDGHILDGMMNRGSAWLSLVCTFHNPQGIDSTVTTKLAVTVSIVAPVGLINLIAGLFDDVLYPPLQFQGLESKK